MIERDWPESLRINAASVHLAEALHHARSEAFIPGMMHFEELPARIRKAYIDTASAILQATKPAMGLPEDVDIGPLLRRDQMKVVVRGR